MNILIFECFSSLRPKNTCSSFESQKPAYKFECTNDGSRSSHYFEHRYSSLTCGSGLSSATIESSSFYPSCTSVGSVWIKSFCTNQTSSTKLDEPFNSDPVKSSNSKPIADNNSKYRDPRVFQESDGLKSAQISSLILPLCILLLI